LIYRSDENDEEALVGWPPVNHQRKKHRCNDEDDDYDHNQRNFVKVKMEGEGIARKVNLTMHNSFHTLNQTLINMFGKCTYVLYI
jgi:auxin-responsive protein IAA